MTCIFKTYHTVGALTWKNWKDEHKNECWRKFMEYFILAEESNEADVKNIFLAYEKANWSKWFYNARVAAGKVDPNFINNPESIPPPVHLWIGETEWREFCKVWSSPEWQKMSTQARANRNLEVAKLVPHCGKIPLEERLANEPEPSNMLRGLEIGHKKKNGEWGSTVAETLHGKYRNELEAKCDDIEKKTGVRPSPDKVDMSLKVYITVTGGASKGRLIGRGRAYSPPRYSSTSSYRLRIVEEELRKSKEREEEQNRKLEEQNREMEERYRQMMEQQQRKLEEKHNQLMENQRREMLEEQRKESEVHQRELVEQRRVIENTNSLVATLMSQFSSLTQQFQASQLSALSQPIQTSPSML